MTPRLLVACIALTSALSLAAPKESVPPKPLVLQVQRMVDLLRDPFASGYPEATMAQIFKLSADEKLALVVFTIEGFGGGNNHTQYLSAFSVEANESGTDHYRLIDVISIGGKAWRSIERLNAKFRHDAKLHETRFEIDALEVTAEDAPNFPSKKVKLIVVLSGGRLHEKAAP